MALSGMREGLPDRSWPRPDWSAPGRKRLRSRGWWLAVPGVLTVAAVVTVAILAGTYQPLTFGSTGNSAELYPGLPAGVGITPSTTSAGSARTSTYRRSAAPSRC